MTEAEWLAGEEPILLLRHLDPDPNGRPALLLTCACLRRLGDLPTAAHTWVEVAGEVAEGLGSMDTFPHESAEDALYDLEDEGENPGAVLAALEIFSVRWRDPLWTPGETPEPYMVPDWRDECREQARL